MMTLDELAGKWQTPVREEDFSLPTITNFQGLTQAAWSISGVQNWICAPTALPTPTGQLYHRDGERIRRFDRQVEYRWKAYEIERRGQGIHTALRMPEGRNAFIERMRFERAGTFYLVFTGLPRVWRFTDYWNLPPEDVPMFNVRKIEGGFLLDDTKTFGIARFQVPGRLNIYDDLVAWLDGEAPSERGKVGVAEFTVAAGETIAWGGVQGCEEELPPLDMEVDWESGKRHWERTWRSAFTPGNGDFSGHLPENNSELARLYYISVISLLNTRRFIPRPHPRAAIATGGQCIWSEDKEPLHKAYVWGGPEGAPTTSFLWEMEFQAPLLARLDPAVLREQLEAMISVDLGRHWGIEVMTSRGAGMYYGVNPGCVLQCFSDYVRITGDKAFALKHLDYLKGCLRPELTDYGACQHILECVSTYEHTLAAFNALAVSGLRFMAELTGDGQYARQADALARKVLGLYAGGPWACIMPDGERRVVKTVLDFVYVGRCMTRDLPEDVKRGMVAFFESELQTSDWLRALSPKDPDALTRKLPTFQTYRADHQATGSYDGWPGRAASVLLRFGLREKAERWLKNIQELTYEGPFCQAHFIHDYGTRRASFYNGNCSIEACGSGFASAMLDDM
jgi:hypothetical protein